MIYAVFLFLKILRAKTTSAVFSDTFPKDINISRLFSRTAENSGTDTSWSENRTLSIGKYRLPLDFCFVSVFAYSLYRFFFFIYRNPRNFFTITFLIGTDIPFINNRVYNKSILEIKAVVPAKFIDTKAPGHWEIGYISEKQKGIFLCAIVYFFSIDKYFPSSLQSRIRYIVWCLPWYSIISVLFVLKTKNRKSVIKVVICSDTEKSWIKVCRTNSEKYKKSIWYGKSR